MGKRLVNSREGKVLFDKPHMDIDILMKYGRALTQEQENVKRVQLAEAYMSGKCSKVQDVSRESADFKTAAAS